MCRFNIKQIINHFLNGNILTDFCSKSHELLRVKVQNCKLHQNEIFDVLSLFWNRTTVLLSVVVH